MAQFFIRRPVFAMVISLVILLAGGLSIQSLPITLYPQITPPTVEVEINYPGANAETVEQAKENCRYGLQWVFEYLSHIIPLGDPNDPPPPTDFDEFVDSANESGRMVIGTPEMAIEQLQRLQEKTGGFGTYMFLGADIANWRATKESYELFAYEVMPHFTGQAAPVQDSYDLIIGAGSKWVDATLGAQLTEIASYEEERTARS